METEKDYYQILVNAVVSRKGDLDPFLKPQIEVASMCWHLYDKCGKELLAGSLMTKEKGSKGQDKSVVNPLMPFFLKTSMTLLATFKSLGLNYDSTPSKIEDAGKEGYGDPLAEILSEA